MSKFNFTRQRPGGREGKRGLILKMFSRVTWNKWLSKQKIQVLLHVRNNTQQSCLENFQNRHISWKYTALLKQTLFPRTAAVLIRGFLRPRTILLLTC